MQMLLIFVVYIFFNYLARDNSKNVKSQKSWILFFAPIYVFGVCVYVLFKTYRVFIKQVNNIFTWKKKRKLHFIILRPTSQLLNTAFYFLKYFSDKLLKTFHDHVTFDYWLLNCACRMLFYFLCVLVK